MEAGVMHGGTSPPSPLPPPARPENAPPQLPLSSPIGSRLHGVGIHHSDSPLRSSSSVRSNQSLEKQRHGEICGEELAAGGVGGDPHTSAEVGGETQEFQWNKSRKKDSIPSYSASDIAKNIGGN